MNYCLVHQGFQKVNLVLIYKRVGEYATSVHSKANKLPVKFRNTKNFDLLLPCNISSLYQ